MDFIDPNSGDALYEMFEKEGLHRILSALIHVYIEKNNNEKDNILNYNLNFNYK